MCTKAAESESWRRPSSRGWVCAPVCAPAPPRARTLARSSRPPTALCQEAPPHAGKAGGARPGTRLALLGRAACAPMWLQKSWPRRRPDVALRHPLPRCPHPEPDGVGPGMLPSLLPPLPGFSRGGNGLGAWGSRAGKWLPLARGPTPGRGSVQTPEPGAPCTCSPHAAQKPRGRGGSLVPQKCPHLPGASHRPGPCSSCPGR